MEELRISVGDLLTTVRVPDDRFADILSDRYAAFLVENSDNGYTVDLELIDDPFEIGHRLPTVVCVNGTTTISRQDTLATSSATDTWTVQIIRNEYTFDSFFRVLLTIRLLDEGGFLLHSSAQIRNKQGLIFTGKSESGKTTISRLGIDNRVLCDELPMVRRIDDHYRVYGTPFWGEFTRGTCTESHDVDALFFLNKAPFNRTQPVTMGKAMPRLLQTTLFFSNEPKHIECLMRICLDYLSAVPAYDLYFKPEPEVWQAVDARAIP